MSFKTFKKAPVLKPSAKMSTHFNYVCAGDNAENSGAGAASDSAGGDSKRTSGHRGASGTGRRDGWEQGKESFLGRSPAR